MSSAKTSTISASIRDPSTFLQRPTSAKTPDVSHILTSLFGEAYTKDVLSAEVIKNLMISSDVDDEYHKRYVQKLKDAQCVKENRVQEYAMLEKHILEARAKALAYEEREDHKRNKICENPDNFGVPPAKSYFSYCLDDTLLKDHGLLVPSDYYYRAKQPFVPMPKSESPRSHLRHTVTSKKKSHKESRDFLLPPINSMHSINDIDELHKEGSELSGDINVISSNEYDTTDDENEEENERRKPFWKDALRQEERSYDKEKLKRLDDRTHFLANPRLEAVRVAQITENPETVFEITPKFILFNKYVIGKVYESSFEVRNVSVIAHQMRAIPPKTQFFSLSLGQYPQGQSVIAPGLSASFNVRFVPDSLCTFEDEILVECSNGSKIRVPLIAKRESPSLSIGSVINCGQSLVGQIKVCRFLIQNEGGDGRFVIMSKSSWPITTFKTNVSSSLLNLYPFEIQPSIFELHKGDVFAIEVVFKPPDVKRYEQDIIIACDNCTTIEFKLIGEGELAEVEYLAQEDDQSTVSQENIIAFEDFKDKLSSKIIRFPALNPSVYTRKRFAIKNKSASPIDYSWITYKPVLEDSLLLEESLNKNSNYTVDKDSLFSIAPKQGTLDRNETKTFEIMFSPNKVGSYSSVSHLVLHGIPEINKQLMLDNVARKTQLTKEDTNTTDFIATVLELRGECEPFQFTLDPPAIFVPGSTYMHSTTRKAFRLINMSICPINFNWKQILEPHVIQVEPSYGEIAPKSYALMDVLITGTKPGKIVEDIPCYVEFAEEPVYFHIEAEIKGPELIIREAGLDFGLVQIGNESKSFIMIENISNLPLNWNLSCPEDLKNTFKFHTNGELKPLEEKKISIIFVPQIEMILNTQFEFKVKDGNELIVNCYGQSQRPSASFLKSEIIIGDMYLNVLNEKLTRLCNHSVLEAQFSWGKAEGEDAPFYEIVVEPSTGLMKSKSVLDCKIQIKSSKLGDINDLRIPCYIHDATEPLFLNIKGITKGVSVNFYYSESKEYEKPIQLYQGSDLIDFGNLKAGDCIQKYFFITNTSGIETQARLEIKNFQAFEDVIDNENVITDPMKKTRNLSDKYKLKDNTNGIGFGLEKSNLTLRPFQTACISVAAIAEMWGTYEDILMVNIEGIIYEHFIPIQCNVVDTPIRLYTGKITENQNEPCSMIRFGSQIQGSGLINRKLKIQNTSFIPMEIHWKIFLKDSSDEKLIDFNMEYRDLNDNDIEKHESSISHRSNPPKESPINHENMRNLETVRESATTLDYYDSGYIYVERVPLIKVSLTNHYGIELNDPSDVFFLDKNKISLKAREKTVIDVNFNTVVEKSGAYEVIFIGYLNLPTRYVKGPGFDRKIGFDMEPIRFKATGNIETPNLRVEIDEDELSFDMALGDLIKNQNELSKEKIFNNKFSLLNTSLAPIEFSMDINKPFYFKDFSNKSERNVLKPKAKLKVDVLCKMDDEFKDFEFSDKSQVLIKDAIRVQFLGNIEQLIPISAKVYAPELKITKNNIDFGTSLVGQERCHQFVMRNPSYSSVLWNITIANDQHSVFRCDLQHGLLEANKVFINKNEQLINVYFIAKHNEYYNSRLIISSRPNSNKPPLIIELKGTGTYDQKLEAILNV